MNSRLTPALLVFCVSIPCFGAQDSKKANQTPVTVSSSAPAPTQANVAARVAPKSTKQPEEETAPSDKKHTSHRNQTTTAGNKDRAGKQTDQKISNTPEENNRSEVNEAAQSDVTGTRAPGGAKDDDFGTGSEPWPNDKTPANPGVPPVAAKSILGALPSWTTAFPYVNLLLAVLLLAAVIVTRRDLTTKAASFQQRVDTRMSALENAIRSVKPSPGHELLFRVDKLERTGADIQRNLAELRNRQPGSHDLDQRNAWVQGKSADLSAMDFAGTQSTPGYRGPIPVSDYLVRARESDRGVVRLQTDSVNDHVFVAASDGYYFLMREDDGCDYAIPYHERFTTKQLYDTYYTSAYDCRAPAAGTVWVLHPASLKSQGDLWRLDERGEIEVRST